MALEAAASFEQFARRYRTSLRLSATAMCHDWHAADDLVQEALVILYRNWNDIEPRARAAYAQTVMAHLVTHSHRSGRWQREFLSYVLPEPDTPSREEEVVDRLVIKDAVGGLPVRQQSAVYFRYWEGMPTKAIAQTLGVPAGTVRSDLARALFRLRGVLRNSFPRRLAVVDAEGEK